MTQKTQKAGGGGRKYGRNKVKCEQYRSRAIRYQNKLKKWIKHNISKSADKDEQELRILEFKEIQDNRKKGNKK